MKIINKILGVATLVFMLMVSAPLKGLAQYDYISQQDFYDELEPYGTWVYDAQYGDVWVPDVDTDFQPYATSGHWVLTEYGNTWVSDYEWGWAPFHYGRWRFDDYYGWTWIPGYEWAPAWVTWRHGAGYYGWAPLMPGVSINVSLGDNYNVPSYYWAFAPQAYINSPNIYNYYLPPTRVVNVIRQTTVVRNTFVRGGVNYLAGPRAADIQRYTRRRPTVYAINDIDRPGAVRVQNRTVNIFRPAVRRVANARPDRIVDGNAYKRQNPGQNIVRREQGGALRFDRNNAAKLASVARSGDNNVVRVNRPVINSPDPNKPMQPRRPEQRYDRSSQRRPVGQQPDQPSFTPNRDQRPGNQSDDLKAREEQLRGQQKAVREQRRQEWIREGQEQSVGRVPQPPPIYGETPVQQQQRAVRDQRRQLERQQQQADRAQRDQQFQRQQQQQAENVARDQQRQAQQEAQRAQRDQQLQRQQQQQAENVARDQQRQAQQEAQRAQRDQQLQFQRQQQQQAERAARDQKQQIQRAQQEQQLQAQQEAQRVQREQQQQAQREQQRQAQQEAQRAQREQQQQAQRAQQEQQRQQQRQAEQAQREQQLQFQRQQQQQQQNNNQQQQQRGGGRRP